MKKLLLFAAFFSFTSILFSQCPTTEVYLATQADIDDFASNYPNCTTLTHALWIGNESGQVTNLNGLTAVTSAQDIYIRNTEVIDFSGLDNLEDIIYLSIWFNDSIQNLDGLTSLQSVLFLDIFINLSMTDLSGLDSIQTIENLHIFSNPALSDISHLSFIETINSLTINSNALTSLIGLENIHTVFEDLEISNESITNFSELAALQTIGRSLHITNNTEINDLTAFGNIDLLEELYIINCPNLGSFSGLENIQNVNGRLRIGFNEGLTDLSVFSNLNSVEDLDIYANDNLESLSGLENLQQVNNRLFIAGNMSLTSIEAINDLSTSQVSEVVVVNNANLSTCNNLFMCTVINDPGVQKSIYVNSPGCNSTQEVETSCLLSVSDIALNDAIVVYPNPVSEILQINASEGITIQKTVLFSVLGEQLLSTSAENINLSGFSEGIYFVEILTNQGKLTRKIVKQ